MSKVQTALEQVCVDCSSGSHGSIELENCGCACHGKGLYECVPCGKRFSGERAASEWIKHSTPFCLTAALRETSAERAEAELKAAVQARTKREQILTEALVEMLEHHGWGVTMEILADFCDSQSEEARGWVKGAWVERRNALRDVADLGNDVEAR